MTGRQLAIAAAAEAEHVGDDLRRACAGLLDAIQQLRDLAVVQVQVDRGQVDAGFGGGLGIARQVGGEPGAVLLRQPAPPAPRRPRPPGP